MSPEFCLRWNNHRPNLVNVFKELLHHEVLVDVTLAAEGQFIHAHRLVLSACSLYFKELFAVNPCQHPIVILKDFHIADLKTVVEFIYQGEVNVAQERLPNVLKTAESLRIKGLAENPRTFEDYQQQQQQQPQTSNSSATPRLGSQSSQQQSSSLSDSLDQQSVEGEEGPPASPHSPVPPPHKRKRVHAAYEHHDTTPALVPASVGSTEGVRVKEEPVSGNGHQRHSSAAASDAAQTGGSENESTNNRDSPSDKSVGGGGGGGGGGSPTPPPPLSLTPSLSNVSIAPGDSAAPALTPPDCSVPLGQQQGGVGEGRPSTLAPASPFISTCHSTTTSTTPTTSSTPTAESTSTSSTAAITSSSAVCSVDDGLCGSIELPVSPAHHSPRDVVANDHASSITLSDQKFSKAEIQSVNIKENDSSHQLASASTVLDENQTDFDRCLNSSKLNSDTTFQSLVDGGQSLSISDSVTVKKASPVNTGNRASNCKDSTLSNGNTYESNSLSAVEKSTEQIQKSTSENRTPASIPAPCSESVSITKSGNSTMASQKLPQTARGDSNQVINITPKKSEPNTSSLIAEALKKLSNSSNSLTIVNISTNQGTEEKSSKVFSPKLEVRRRREVQPVCKVEAADVPLDTKEFNFDTEENSCKSPRASSTTVDSKDFFATLTNSCPSKTPSSRELTSGVEVNHTAAMMMMLNNNNTTVTPAPTYSSSTGPGFKRPRVPEPSAPGGGPCFPLASHDAPNGCASAMNTNNTSAPHNGPLNNLSLPSLLAPLGPHAPSFLLSPHSWHQQFRCMSPNMLMAIEAVRAGKMGFTQAGRTFGVNGRTLWVYYRRLGYKVHNTFRGRRSKDTSNTNNIMTGLPQPLTSHPLNSNNFNHNRLPPNFNPNSSIFFGNGSNGNNNFSTFGSSGSNLLSRGMSSSNIKLPAESQNASFQSFQSKFFDNSTTGNDSGNNNSAGVVGECAPQHGVGGGGSSSSSMASCIVGGSSNASGFGLNHESNNDDVNREVPSPSSLIGPMFGAGSSYSQEETDANAYGASTNDLASNQMMNCSQQQASFTQAAGFGPVFFGNGSNFVGFGGSEGASLSSGLSSVGSNSSHVKQELTDACAAERQLAEGTREVEEANSTLEALLEACTNRAGWQHSAM